MPACFLSSFGTYRLCTRGPKPLWWATQYICIYFLYLILLQLQQVKSWVLMLLLLLSHFSRVWLCDPIDGSPPGFPVPQILQARTLVWVAISFSNAWKGKVKVKSFSRVRLLATPWTAAYQAPPSLGFSRQEHWSGLPFPFPVHEREKGK